MADSGASLIVAASRAAQAPPDIESPALLLDELLTSRGAGRRRLICQAEAVAFPPAELHRLLEILWRYIIESRDSNERDELIAVAAAIRKCVAMMEVSRIGEVAALLEAGHRSCVPLEIELEVAKMVYRKFEANPPAARDPEPLLGQRLEEFAVLYLNPRILPREKHAAVAMLAIQALAAMRSPRAEAIVETVNASPFAWFRQQLRRRLARTLALWVKAPADAVHDLASFVARLHTD